VVQAAEVKVPDNLWLEPLQNDKLLVQIDRRELGEFTVTFFESSNKSGRVKVDGCLCDVVDGADYVVERVAMGFEEERETVEVDVGYEIGLESYEQRDLRGVCALELDCLGYVGRECFEKVLGGQVLLEGAV
jgi:hypothetical protein